MQFRIIDQHQCHKKIGNNALISLKMLVLAVWISVWMPVKKSKNLEDGKCLKKLCKNSEYFEDLTELTKRGKLIKSS